MNLSHSSIVSLSKLSCSWFIHVSLWMVNMVIEFWSKVVISGNSTLVWFEDKLSSTTVDFWRPEEVHSSGWKLVFKSNHCTVPEITTLLQDSTNSMRNLHLMVIELFIDLILSFRSALLAFLIIYLPLGVFTLLLSLTLTGIRSSLRHLRENLLWFEKSAILYSNFFLLLEGFNIFLSIFWSNLSMDVSHSVLVICLELIFSWTELIFVKKTSFHLISAKASSGLRKMFSQYYYNQNGVWENVCLAILDTHFPYYVMADVKPYVWWIIMLSLKLWLLIFDTTFFGRIFDYFGIF